MIIIFILCFYICRPIKHEWYAYIICIIITPTLCAFLFSKKIDQFMSIILNIPYLIVRHNNDK